MRIPPMDDQDEALIESILLDDFAGQAMAALMARHTYSFDQVAEGAYKAAMEMIKARRRFQEQLRESQ
jgi:hypothetical protein